MEYDVYAGETLVARAALLEHPSPPGLPPMRMWLGSFVPTSAYQAIAADCVFEPGPDAIGYQQRQRALALTLRGPDGAIVPTRFVRLQDSSAAVSRLAGSAVAAASRYVVIAAPADPPP